MTLFGGTQRYRDDAGNIIEEKLKCLLPNSNVLVAISKGMQAAKPCSNKILQFLAGVPANAYCPVVTAVKRQ